LHDFERSTASPHFDPRSVEPSSATNSSTRSRGRTPVLLPESTTSEPPAVQEGFGLFLRLARALAKG
jgi:hypothetical protein